MWYVWFYSSFCGCYVRCMLGFKSVADAQCAVAEARAFADVSYIVLPY